MASQEEIISALSNLPPDIKTRLSKATPEQKKIFIDGIASSIKSPEITENKSPIDIVSSLKSGWDSVTKPTPEQIIQMSGIDPIQRFGKTALSDIYKQGRSQLVQAVPEGIREKIGTGMSAGLPPLALARQFAPKQVDQFVGDQSTGLGIDLGMGLAVGGAENLARKTASGASAFGNWAKNKVGVNYSEQISNLQRNIEATNSRAAFEKEALGKQVGYNISNLEEQKASTLGRFDAINKEAENINKQAIADIESKSKGLGDKLPDVAYKSGQKFVERFKSLIRKHSQEYRASINKMLGGRNSDVYIDTDTALSSIETSLIDRGVATSIDDTGKMIGEGTLSSAESRLVRMYNKIAKRDGAIGFREMLKNKQMLGRQVGYGKTYGYEDDLIDEVAQKIGSSLKKELPELAGIDARTSQFLKLKGEASSRLDLFKPGSSKPRTFVESYATGKMTPEEKVFLDQVKKELPDFERITSGPTSLGQGQKQYEASIAKLKSGNKQGAIDGSVTAIDKQIETLKSNQEILSNRIANKSFSETESSRKSIEVLQRKLNRLKKAKDILITVGSLGGAYYGLRAAINYGYSAAFTDKP